MDISNKICNRKLLILIVKSKYSCVVKLVAMIRYKNLYKMISSNYNYILLLRGNE